MLLSLTSQPQVIGKSCPGPILLTCVGLEIMSDISWVLNGSTITTYMFQDVNSFPILLDINPAINNIITAEVINVAASIATMNAYNVTLTLTIKDISQYNGTSVQCKSAGTSVESTTQLAIASGKLC